MAQVRSAIRYARDRTERVWYPEQIGDHSGIPTTDLHCGGCSAPVTAFRETILRTNTVRSAHFKLKAGRGEQTHHHDPDCTFNLRTAVTTLLRHTRTVSYSRRRRRWQIAFPDDAAAGPAEHASGGPDRLSAGPVRDHHRTTGADDRLALLNDVRRVATLLHQHRDDPASATLFEGIWKGGVIGWDDLYYPPDRHQDLLTRLRAGTRGRIDQPIAVSGQITSSRPPTDTRAHRTLYLALHRDTRRTRTNLVVRGTPELLPDFAVDQSVVVLTQWALWTPPGARRVEYCTGWLNWPHQITTIDPDLLDP